MRNFVVDLLLRILQRTPGPVEHNLAKAKVLRRAFFQCSVDGVEGNYFEFGVAKGDSMKSATLANDYAHYQRLGIQKIERKFYGFDTFTGF
jgi:hypothetical protein